MTLRFRVAASSEPLIGETQGSKTLRKQKQHCGISHEDGKAKQREDEHAQRRQNVGKLRDKISSHL